MKVTVRFYGVRRELIDRPLVEVTLPPEATLRSLLEALGQRFGDKVRRQLFAADGKHLGDTICLSINDRLMTDRSLERPLKSLGPDEPDVDLAVVFAIAGG